MNGYNILNPIKIHGTLSTPLLAFKFFFQKVLWEHRKKNWWLPGLIDIFLLSRSQVVEF